MVVGFYHYEEKEFELVFDLEDQIHFFHLILAFIVRLRHITAIFIQVESFRVSTSWTIDANSSSQVSPPGKIFRIRSFYQIKNK